MELLRFLAILSPHVPVADHPSLSSDSIPQWYVGLIATLMFLAGLVLLVGGLHRWLDMRKRRRSLAGWNRNHHDFRNAA